MGTGARIRCLMNRTSTVQGVGSQLVEIAVDTPKVFFSVVNVACVIRVRHAPTSFCVAGLEQKHTWQRSISPSSRRIILGGGRGGLILIVTCLGQSHTCPPMAWCLWMDPSSSYL